MQMNEAFATTSAQIIPVFALAAAVEARLLSRIEPDMETARPIWETAKYGARWVWARLLMVLTILLVLMEMACLKWLADPIPGDGVAALVFYVELAALIMLIGGPVLVFLEWNTNRPLVLVARRIMQNVNPHEEPEAAADPDPSS